MSKFAMFGHFDSTELVIFGLLQTWECVLSWFLQVKPVHKPNLDIRRLRGFGEAYPKHVFFLLIPMCESFPTDLKICMTLKQNISQTSTVGIFSCTCVGGCKTTWKVCSCGTATRMAKLPKKSKK